MRTQALCICFSEEDTMKENFVNLCSQALPSFRLIRKFATSHASTLLPPLLRCAPLSAWTAIRAQFVDLFLLLNSQFEAHGVIAVQSTVQRFCLFIFPLTFRLSMHTSVSCAEFTPQAQIHSPKSLFQFEAARFVFPKPCRKAMRIAGQLHKRDMKRGVNARRASWQTRMLQLPEKFGFALSHEQRDVGRRDVSRGSRPCTSSELRRHRFPVPQDALLFSSSPLCPCFAGCSPLVALSWRFTKQRV